MFSAFSMDQALHRSNWVKGNLQNEGKQNWTLDAEQGGFLAWLWFSLFAFSRAALC